MTTNTNMTAREAAAAYLSAKGAARTKIAKFIGERAKVSARKRWANLARAIDAGDTARVEAHSLTGEAKREAWAAIRASEKPAGTKPAAKAKPATTRKPKRATAKRGSVRMAKPAASENPLEGLSDEQRAVAMQFLATLAATK